MVDQSELAYRLLLRRHGCQLCFSPMIPAGQLLGSTPARRQQLLASSPADRPLIVQLGGNCPDQLLAAGLLVQAHKPDGIDLNLGCPQKTAAKGRWGAFLMDDLPLVERIVTRLVQGLNLPVSAKIRVFADVSATVGYARMLERAGVSMITVHGRTREARHGGLADWAQIAQVQRAVNVPVIANGNVRCMQDAEACLAATGCAAVMSGYGVLRNPGLFDGRPAGGIWDLASEYLELCAAHPPAQTRLVADHLLAMLDPLLFGPDRQPRPVMRDVVHALRHPGWFEHVGLAQLAQLLALVRSRQLGEPERLTLKQIKHGPQELEEEPSAGLADLLGGDDWPE